MAQSFEGITVVPEALLFIRVKSESVIAPLRRCLSDRFATYAETLQVELAFNNLRPSAGIGDTVSSSERVPDIIVSAKGKQSVLFDAVVALAQGVDEYIDPDGTSVMGARCHDILVGWGPVRLHYGLRRLPHLDREAFQSYWLGHHADIGRALIPPYSYYQSHADQQLTDALTAILGWPAANFDGVATVHFPDQAAFDRQLGRDDVAEIALADEKVFIDHSRAQFGMLSCQKFS